MHSHLSGPTYPVRPPPPPGQRVTVIPQRELGVKRRGKPLEGYLVIEAEERRPEILIRQSRSTAKLYRSTDRMMGGHSPLFDPEIVAWDCRGVFLQGWEIDEGVQYVQVWQVLMTPAASVQASDSGTSHGCSNSVDSIPPQGTI